jgi:DNA-directed RNA polymerase specialized sigma24 family protein
MRTDSRTPQVAYRMLGSLSEADDAVQDAWLRLGRSDADEIETWPPRWRRSSHAWH